MSAISWLFGRFRRKTGAGRTAQRVVAMLKALGFTVIGTATRTYVGRNQRDRGAWLWSADVIDAKGYEVLGGVGSQWPMTSVLKAHKAGTLEVNREDGAVHLDIERSNPMAR